MIKNTPYGLWAAISIPEQPSTEGLVAVERAYAARLTPLRRRTWVAGRLAARRAFQKLGIDHPAPILANERGGPKLCGSWVVSISHKHNVAVALVADSRYGHVGIDVEMDKPASLRIPGKILTPQEHKDVIILASPEHAVLRYFSAKEAIYKALNPYIKRYVGFKEVELSPDFKVRFDGPYTIDVMSTNEQLGDDNAIVSIARVKMNF